MKVSLRSFHQHKQGRSVIQRLSALFLLSVFLAGTLAPTASALIANPDDYNYPGAMSVQKSKNDPAADYAASVEPTGPNTDSLSTQNVATKLQGLQTPDTGKKQYQERELTDRRTANTETFQNRDGTLTTKQYYAPRLYQKSGDWQRIDTSLRPLEVPLARPFKLIMLF